MLTQEQEIAVQRALETLSRPGGAPPEGRLYKLGGYAGTGKTTVLKEICQRAGPGLAVCAYTGKAASVLIGKGVQATTIHRQIYTWDEESEEFYARERPAAGVTAFAIDEASMVGQNVFEDLMGYGLPILAIGDPGQLEPIGAGEINLMASPDYVLSVIHRQALDNPIISLASDIRLGGNWQVSDLVKSKSRVLDRLLEWDVIICGFNKTRKLLNDRIRASLGRSGGLCRGEKIIVLKNNASLGVYNGQCISVLEILEETKPGWKCIVSDGLGPRPLCISRASFGKSLSYDESKHIKKYAIADYGYAITCHKSQGSEWEKVAVIDEQCDLWSAERWRYTAVTRASKELGFYV